MRCFKLYLLAKTKSYNVLLLPFDKNRHNFKLITYSADIFFTNTKVAVRFFSSFANSSLISSFLDLITKKIRGQIIHCRDKTKESGHTKWTLKTIITIIPYL